LTRDPELRHLPSNVPVCSFGLAVNDRYKDKQSGEWVEKPNFIDCEAFGRSAELIQQYVSKGRPLFVEGKLRFDQWDDKQTGQKRSKLKVIVDTFQFMGGRNEGDGGGGGGYNRGSAAAAGNAGSQPNYAAPSAGPVHEPVDEDDIPF
ncbi:MAG: single-stranded DNA-binding protein, partial [Planctomycetota bacterium]